MQRPRNKLSKGWSFRTVGQKTYGTFVQGDKDRGRPRPKGECKRKPQRFLQSSPIHRTRSIRNDQIPGNLKPNELLPVPIQHGSTAFPCPVPRPPRELAGCSASFPEQFTSTIQPRSNRLNGCLASTLTAAKLLSIRLAKHQAACI